MSPHANELRAGVLAALAAGVLLAPAAADAKRFSVKAPKPGQVVIAQIRGTSTGNEPPRLTLTNPGALRGTVVVSSIWKAKGGGAAYDGILVLLRKEGPGSSARTPAGNPPPAIFNAPPVQTVNQLTDLDPLGKLLEATARKRRERAAKNQCKNNLRSRGRISSGYHTRTRLGTPPVTVARQACAAALDQTVPGAPRFWKSANQPFCAMNVDPFGTAGDEVRISGSCNHSISAFAVFPPAPLNPTACLPFPGSSCEVTPEGFVFFQFSSPFPPSFLDLQANVRTDQGVGDRGGWVGGAGGPDVGPFYFPLDPGNGPPPFP